MSLYQMGMNSQEVDPTRMQMAELEMESLTALFDSLMNTCRSKCIPAEYGEGDINKGESVCIDRCVNKYFTANLKIGQLFRDKGITPGDTQMVQNAMTTYNAQLDETTE
ncbi:Mitochondrial import inner membrane translocase subunit tim10 [Yarrowia sp. C11]|nr:Mitochondrial import inner membrane translocase subunit tim10 [Yarrowia sp. E02]KAG5365276.1 Mitochondrial import inner membrane translocase subunit tim10 [Yarrowia sp. C11]